MTKPIPKTADQVYHAAIKAIARLSRIDSLNVVKCLAAAVIYQFSLDKGHGLRDLRDEFYGNLVDHLEELPHESAYHDEALHIDDLPMQSVARH